MDNFHVVGKNSVEATNDQVAKGLDFDILDLISEVLATEEFGKGIFFKSNNSFLNKKVKDFVKKNKLNKILWRLLKFKNKNGAAMLKFDILDEYGEDIRISLITDFSYSKAYEELIEAEIINYPIQMKGKKEYQYKIKEFWTNDTITRIFYYDKKTLSFSIFAQKIPIKFQQPELDKIWKEKKSSKDNDLVEYFRDNPLGFLPFEAFENIDALPDLPDSDKWNNLINSLMQEINYDIVLSRPFLNVKSASKALKDYLKGQGLPEGIYFENKSLGNMTEFSHVAAKDRFNQLSSLIETILKLAFNKANSSYATQLERVPARAEELANSKGAKTVFIKRKITENNLELFFEKIITVWGFTNGFNDDGKEEELDWSIKFTSNDGSETERTEQKIRQTAFGLAKKADAIADLEDVDVETAKKMAEEIKKEQPVDKKTDTEVEVTNNSEQEKAADEST